MPTISLYDALQLAYKSDPATQEAIISKISNSNTNPVLVNNLRAALKSHTTMYTINEDGGLSAHSTFENAWGSAMLVWEYMTFKYFPEAPMNAALHDLDHLKRVWALVDDESLPMYERAVLLSTIDGAMCGREYLPRLAALFLEFSDLCSLIFPATRVNTLPEQARTMMRIFENEKVQAICWEHTNWRPPGIPPTWPVDYNINVDEKHWFIEDDLEWTDDKVVA